MSRKRIKDAKTEQSDPGTPQTMGRTIYFCQAKNCPGYSSKATLLVPHTEETCGSILNGYDAPEKTDFSGSGLPVPPTEPHNDPPEPTPVVEQAGVDESNALAPEVAADDSPAAMGEAIAVNDSERHATPEDPRGESLDFDELVDELPSPRAALPRLVTDAEEMQRHWFESERRGVPRTGSCWSEPSVLFDPHCYEITGVNLQERFALCFQHCANMKEECLIRLEHFLNGDLFPYLTAPPFIKNTVADGQRSNVVFPLLLNPEARGLRASLPISTYIPVVGSWWVDDFPARDVQCAQWYQVRFVDESVKLKQTGSEIYVTMYVPPGTKDSVTLPFSKFLDGTLRFVADPEKVPKWITSARDVMMQNPLGEGDIPPLGEEQETPSPLVVLANSCGALAIELGVPPAHLLRLVDGCVQFGFSFVTAKQLVNTSPAIAALVEKMKTPDFLNYFRGLLGVNASEMPGTEVDERNGAMVDKVCEYINEKLEPRIDKLEARLGTDDGEKVPLEQIEEMMRMNKEVLEEVLGRITNVEERMDEVEADRLRRDETNKKARKRQHASMRKPKGEHARETPEGKARRARKQRAAREAARREQEALSRNARQEKLLDSDDYQEPAKQGRGRPKGSTLATGAASPAKRGRGRPKGSKTKKKGPKLSDHHFSGPGRSENAGKPIAPKVDGWIVDFMGVSGEKKVVSLLQKIDSKKVKRFLEQATVGIPSMDLTPWSGKEYSTFATWFFTER